MGYVAICQVLDSGWGHDSLKERVSAEIPPTTNSNSQREGKQNFPNHIEDPKG